MLSKKKTVEGYVFRILGIETDDNNEVTNLL